MYFHRLCFFIHAPKRPSLFNVVSFITFLPNLLPIHASFSQLNMYTSDFSCILLYTYVHTTTISNAVCMPNYEKALIDDEFW
jgi:hypothetical protein